MAKQTQDYRIDREHLHEIANLPFDWTDPSIILQKVKGKELRFYIYDRSFERHDVRAVILGTADEAPGNDHLWVEDWKGHPGAKPWAIKILERYPLYE